MMRCPNAGDLAAVQRILGDIAPTVDGVDSMGELLLTSVHNDLAVETMDYRESLPPWVEDE